MLKDVTGKYAGGCVMLMKRVGEDVHFLGTAFFVHQQGYLLSAAHVFNRDDELLAVPALVSEEFTPMTLEHVNPMPVKVSGINHAQDVALLKLESELEIGVPGNILGRPEDTAKGTTVMAMGFSFGHYRLHNLISIHAVLASKVISPNGTRVLLFDRMVHHGDAGGPLVNAQDGRIIGIVLGRFDLMDIARTGPEKAGSQGIDISYAVSIEYAVELMEGEGLDLP